MAQQSYGAPSDIKKALETAIESAKQLDEHIKGEQGKAADDAVRRFLMQNFDVFMADDQATAPILYPDFMYQGPVVRINWYNFPGDPVTSIRAWNAFVVSDNQDGTLLGMLMQQLGLARDLPKIAIKGRSPLEVLGDSLKA
jgi:hypothetical protein